MKKFSKEVFKELLNEQVSSAKKIEVIDKKIQGSGSTRREEKIFAWKGKYDPWLLEPLHIAMKLGVSLNNLERLILDEEDAELTDLWKDYKKFQLTVMMYDENFGQIRPQLAEFALSKFDKNETTKTDAIIKLPTQEIVELKLEVKRLKKELENVQNEKS